MVLKKLRCEMCGSNDLIKQNDFFECQNCGTKYSIEEIKKIIVERSINTSNDIAKQNNNGNIENYLSMAKNAYTSNNMSESENYCNKILEIDNKNYLAWLLKGKLTGLKLQIEGAINCFSNALDNTSKSETDEIKNNIITEILNLNLKLMSMYCEQYKETLDKFRLDMDVANYIIDTAEALKKISIELLLKCGGKENDLNTRLARTIFNFAMKEFVNEYDNYTTAEVKKPSKAMWELLIGVGDVVIFLIETVSNFSDEDNSNCAIEYEQLIGVQKTLINAKFYDYSELDWKAFSENEQQIRRNKIMEWHRKWNEIDPTHIIPTNELKKNEEKRNITNEGKEVIHNYSNTSNNSKRTTYNYSNKYNNSSNKFVKAIIYLILAYVIVYFLFHSDDTKTNSSSINDKEYINYDEYIKNYITPDYDNDYTIVPDEIPNYDYQPGKLDPFSAYE